MPFKSKQQAKMFFARGKGSPKWKRMARRWAKHTPDMKSLPKRAESADLSDPELIQKSFPELSRELSSGIDEMPHIEVNRDVGGIRFGVVDLRFERLPGLTQGDKNKLTHDFFHGGLVGMTSGGKWLHFSDDGISVATRQQVDTLPRMPSDWERSMANVDVREGRDMASMKDVFNACEGISEAPEQARSPEGGRQYNDRLDQKWPPISDKRLKAAGDSFDEWALVSEKAIHAIVDIAYGMSSKLAEQVRKGGKGDERFSELFKMFDTIKKAAYKPYQDIGKFTQELNYPGLLDDPGLSDPQGSPGGSPLGT